MSDPSTDGLKLLGLPVDESKEVPCTPMSEETAANWRKLADYWATSFYERNPDLYKDVLADCVYYGTVQPETAQRLREALEKDQ